MTKVRGCRTAGGYSSRGEVGFNVAGKLRSFVVRTQCVLSVFRLEGVDVDRSIRGLCRDVLVERVPGHALYIMAVFGNLSYQSSCIKG